MNIKSSYRLFFSVFIVLAIILSGCSRKKAGFTNRLYHSTTSLYNWYFNANEMMKQTEDQLWASKTDNYLEMLPVYVLPSEDEQKALYPSMDEIIDKCSTVIDRHSMEIKKKEHNKWIDDNFLLIGIANYYKGKYATAQEMFSYCAKKYKGEDSRFDAALWLARTYIEQKQYNRAITVLSAIERDTGKDRPKDFLSKFETVYSDLYLRQERYQDALPHLEDAARLTTDKKKKARISFILAQTYKELNNSRQAIEAYAEVIKQRPDYEMEFYAKISQALAYDRRLDPQKILDMLWAMAKDEKNTEYYDQIYYALAEIELENQNVEQGVEHLKTSVEKSINNNRQKGQSYLRLAEIYFTDREYVLSKTYYDSTAAYLPEDYPNYKIIIMTGASLNGLVDNIHNVTYNDSIIALALMDEKDRDKKLLKMIVELEAQEEQKKREELAALERIQNTTPIGEKGRSGGSKSWYFYNSATIGSGFQEFKRVWGSRTLEDDWRRLTKSSFGGGDEMGADSDSLLSDLGQEESNVKSLDEYLAELPQTDEEIAAARNIIINSLYDIGTIYKERLKDDNNAIESFVRITNDFDTSMVAPQAYYQLYRIYLEKEQSGDFVGTGFKDNSDYYKDIILSEYPDSEFAKLIIDPNFITSQNQRYEAEKAIYEETYKKYNRRQYTEVLVACNTIIDREPDNNFIAKYYLVKALTVGARKDAGSYETLLREIIAKFSGTPEAEMASELLNELNKLKAELARQQKLEEDADSDPDEEEEAGVTNEDTSMYAYDEESEHFFSLVFPKGEGDATTLKETIADFNAQFFRNAKLRSTNSFIDRDHQILIIRSFGNKDDAMDYYNTFMVNKKILEEINNTPSYKKFVISTKNFTVLFRNKNTEVYQAFFESKYL